MTRDRRDRRAGAPGGRGGRWWELAELLAATGFAIAQPLLSVFGRSPDTFIFRDASRLDVVLFALTVTVVPAAAIWAVELLVGRWSERVATVLHVLALGGLGALMGVQIAKRVLS